MKNKGANGRLVVHNFLRMGEVFRYSRPASPEPPVIEGYRNHYHVTFLSNSALVQAAAGIDAIRKIKAIDGERRPAIVIRSSPHKVGSWETPWLDTFDVDNGHIRYFGDNKQPGKSPMEAHGNKVLLSAYNAHSALEREARFGSVPLLFYRGVRIGAKSKGFIEFQGLGFIRGVELLIQYDRKAKRSFPNFAFDFQVLSLAEENELLDWTWINDRRNPELSLEETLRHAPKAWVKWINQGPAVSEQVRRRVSRLLVQKREEQRPDGGSKEQGALQEIYAYFSTRRTRFEAFASKISARYFKDWAGGYSEGWVTPSTADGGADFYGRLVIGSGFGATRIIVLGQAKCEAPTIPTGGNHIARTVARLRRGWIGIYVTTSWFSESVQREILEDEYPIILINGRKLAELALMLAQERGFSKFHDFLVAVDKEYDGMVKIRRPEELLLV